MFGSVTRIATVFFPAVLLVLGVGAARATDGYGGGNAWWTADSGRRMPASVEYPDSTGRIRIINAHGGFDTKGNAFFSAIGSNGRACITCHQPASGMGLSVAAVRRRWQETQGKDPLFSAFDGSNCPSLPQRDAASHSLLLTLPHGVRPHEFLFYNDKSLLPKGPKTGQFVSMQLRD